MKENSRLSKMWETIKKMIQKAKSLVYKLIIAVKRKVTKSMYGYLTVPKEIDDKYNAINKYYWDKIAVVHTTFHVYSKKSMIESFDSFQETNSRINELENKIKDLKKTEISNSEIENKLSHNFYDDLNYLYEWIAKREKEISKDQQKISNLLNEVNSENGNANEYYDIALCKGEIALYNKIIRATNLMIEAVNFMISVSKDTPIPKKAENVTEAFIDWCDSIYIANESTSNIDKIIIDIFGKEYSITADFSNYSKSGEMTGSQRASYNNFESAKQKILKDVENKLKGYNKDASKIYTPALLKIKKDGELAIAFDEKDNSEGGIVVVILPKMGLLAPDQYF